MIRKQASVLYTEFFVNIIPHNTRTVTVMQ